MRDDVSNPPVSAQAWTVPVVIAKTHDDFAQLLLLCTDHVAQAHVTILQRRHERALVSHIRVITGWHCPTGTWWRTPNKRPPSLRPSPATPGLRSQQPPLAQG